MAKLKRFFKITSLLSCSVFAFLTHAHAATASSNASCQSGFHAGVSLDYHHLGGYQTGTADFSSLGGDANTSVLNKRILSDDTVGGTLHVGYLHRLDDTDFTIGLDPYFGLASLKDKASVANLDSDGTGGTQLATIAQELKRKWTVGIPAKFGFVLSQDYMLYGILGIEFSRFEHKASVTTQSTGAVETKNSKKTIPGFVWGAGFERQFDEYRLGIEVKNARYSKKELKHTFTEETDAITTTNVRPSVTTVAVKASYLF